MKKSMHVGKHSSQLYWASMTWPAKPVRRFFAMSPAIGIRLISRVLEGGRQPKKRIWIRILLYYKDTSNFFGVCKLASPASLSRGAHVHMLIANYYICKFFYIGNFGICAYMCVARIIYITFLYHIISNYWSHLFTSIINLIEKEVKIHILR